MKYILNLAMVCLTLGLSACVAEETANDSSTYSKPAGSTPDVTVLWNKDCKDAFAKIVMNLDNSDGLSLPWLSVYNAQGQNVLHQNGYNSRHKSKWEKLLKGKTYKNNGPNLTDVAVYSDLDPANIPESDLVFVKYSADWCAPCKLQSVDLKVFKEVNANVKITHVEVIADTSKMEEACPI